MWGRLSIRVPLPTEAYVGDGASINRRQWKANGSMTELLGKGLSEDFSGCL